MSNSFFFFFHVQLFMTPWTVAHQVSLSMGFSSHEYWGGCHFLLQGCSWPRNRICNSCTSGNGQADSLPLCHLGNPFEDKFIYCLKRLGNLKVLSPFFAYPSAVSITSPWSVFLELHLDWKRWKHVMPCYEGQKRGALFLSSLCSWAWYDFRVCISSFLTNPFVVSKTYDCRGEGKGKGIVREFGRDTYKLLYLNWITNNRLLQWLRW